MPKIDFIITWVDGNDEQWINDKKHYLPDKDNGMNTISRYRDWELLKYWFRSTEKNAPWVHKIYFVTEGHLPTWLNTNNEKLVVVKHSDYIEKDNLPTFNSNVIELNLHKIKGLSETFVNFNDDMFLNKKVEPTDFFDGLIPKDSGVFSPIVPKRNSISSTVLNNVEVLNCHFRFREVIKKHFFKFFNIMYGKQLIKNICVLPWNRFLGFYDSHIPVSYNKEYFKLVWEKESDLMKEVSTHRFREKDDVNHWLIRYWQLAQGEFSPRSVNFGNYYDISDQLPEILEEINRSKYGVICLNDGEGVIDFNESKKQLIEAFEKRYPQKSSFER